MDRRLGAKRGGSLDAQLSALGASASVRGFTVVGAGEADMMAELAAMSRRVGLGDLLMVAVGESAARDACEVWFGGGSGAS